MYIWLSFDPDPHTYTGCGIESSGSYTLMVMFDNEMNVVVDKGSTIIILSTHLIYIQEKLQYYSKNYYYYIFINLLRTQSIKLVQYILTLGDTVNQILK